LKTEALRESNQKHINVKNFGLKYNTVVQQFRIKTTAIEEKELFKNKTFQESIATVIKS
jgi:hypothetical protein